MAKKEEKKLDLKVLNNITKFLPTAAGKITETEKRLAEKKKLEELLNT